MQHICNTYVAHMQFQCVRMLQPHFISMFSMEWAVCPSLLFLGLLIWGREKGAAFTSEMNSPAPYCFLRKPESLS